MLKYRSKFLSWFLFLSFSYYNCFLTFFSYIFFFFAGEMAPKFSKDSLQAALTRSRAQASQGGALAALSKPAGDYSETGSDSLPLIIMLGKKRTLAEVAELETTSLCQATPSTIVDAPFWLKRACSSPSEPLPLLNDFLLDTPPFFLWRPSFLTQQKGDKLLKSSFDLNMLDVARVTRMLQWVHVASLRFWAITRHLELKERFRDKIIAELWEELIKLRESHVEEI